MCEGESEQVNVQMLGFNTWIQKYIFIIHGKSCYCALANGATKVLLSRIDVSAVC